MTVDKTLTIPDAELDDLLAEILEPEVRQVEQKNAAREEKKPSTEEQVSEEYADLLSPTVSIPSATDFSSHDPEDDGITIAKTKSVVFDPDQFNKDISFSKNDIEGAMLRQAGLFSYYAELAHRLQYRADRAKNLLELKEAEVDQRIREEAVAKSEKVTEAMMEKRCKKDPEYQAQMMKYLDAKMNANMAKDMLEALKQRRDMLVQVGKDKREELLGDLRIMEKDVRLSDAKDRAVKATIKGGN